MLEAITGVSSYTGIVTTLDGDNIGRGFRRSHATEAYSGGAFNLSEESLPALQAPSSEPMVLAAREAQPQKARKITLFTRRRTA